MKKSSYVVDLKAKDEVKSLFLVKYIALLEGKDGKPYLSLILQDKSGELECRKWQGGKTVIDEVSVGQYVYVEGKINQYQNR